MSTHQMSIDDLAEQNATIDAVSRHPVVSDWEYQRFLAMCRHIADQTGGLVPVNRVREAMTNEHGLTLHPRRYSSYWFRASRRSGPLRRVCDEPSTDAKGRNLNKRSAVYEWIGVQP